MQPVFPVQNDTPRVAFVTTTLDLGGTTTYLINLAGELRRRGCSVQIQSFKRNNPLALDFAAQGLDPQLQDDHRLIYEDRLCHILTAVQRFRPQAVVGWDGPNAYEVLRYVPASVPRLVAIHTDGDQTYDGLIPYVQQASCVVAVSTQIAVTLQKLLPNMEEKIHQIPTGVPVPENVSSRNVEEDQPLRILYLGRLCHDLKRVRLFPEIWRSLLRTNTPFEWSIAGDGPDRAYLQQQMPSNRSLSSVRFLGPVPYTAVPALLDQHDVFLLTSDSEGMPVSLLEAMAHGLVPVVSDLRSGIREAVDATTGVLVDPSMTEGYAQAIRWLHEHRSQMTVMAQACHQRARERFSVARMSDQWLSFLRGGTGGEVVWPTAFKLRPRLVHIRPYDFYEPVRSLRRLVKCCRGRFR